MSGQLLHFGGSAHDESVRLLPWLLNETLDADECALVEGHLATCTQCQAELEDLRAIQRACANDVDQAPPPAFAGLRARIEASEPAVASPWRLRLAGLLGGWRRTPGWLQGAACVQAALLVAIATAWSLHDPPASSQSSAYRTLGNGSAEGVAAIGEATLLLVFAPEVDQGQTRRLLRASGARIVDGPSDAGAYVIAVDAAHAAATRDALRAADGVQLVEVLDPGARR